MLAMAFPKKEAKTIVAIVLNFIMIQIVESLGYLEQSRSKEEGYQEDANGTAALLYTYRLWIFLQYNTNIKQIQSLFKCKRNLLKTLKSDNVHPVTSI